MNHFSHTLPLTNGPRILLTWSDLQSFALMEGYYRAIAGYMWTEQNINASGYVRLVIRGQ